MQTPLQLWGGFEQTVNRVGEHFFDQLEWSGHAGRISDLNRVAELGIKTVRYPVLWERTAPDAPDKLNWDWSGERLNRLRKLRIRPIVGLVHHGSGPRYTNLLDPAFAMGLASYARAVAERYPWLDAFTPVNEPLTTARFSGLYGHWYPHERDEQSFVKMLLNECRATVLAMKAIREVNPGASLVQTEDLGKVFSTPLLSYQAEWENHRRWLSFDLLEGRVDRQHPLWKYLIKQAKTDPADLEWFQENHCPPDIFGVNYYLSSERFLDERLHLYPSHYHGGNGRHNYADVEAVRVLANGVAGYSTLLKEVWERYQRPIVVTEAHNGCTREEQLRWLVEGWENCRQLRHVGVDVQALTVWSLMGVYDWDKLVTQANGHYEPGVYDLRSPQPRPTALAKVVRDLATGREPSHPTLHAPGWWQRPERFVYGYGHKVTYEGKTPLPTPLPLNQKLVKDQERSLPPLLITGQAGALGQAFARLCELRGLPYCLLDRRELDITDAGAVERMLAYWQPWGVVNTAGYERVDDAEMEPVACLKVNTIGSIILAEACAQQGISLLTFSSDMVFDGKSCTPYLEDSPTAPLNAYGRSKSEAEQQVLQLLPHALVVRTGTCFGPWDKANFVTIALQMLLSGEAFIMREDNLVSPTYLPDLVHACLDLLVDGESGLWHLANQGAVSWYELVRRAAKLADVPTTRLRGSVGLELGERAKQPKYRVLDSRRGRLLPALDDALARYALECELLNRENWQEQVRSA
jgi:dTDP-4-dehydrorhamnose reductase